MLQHRLKFAVMFTGVHRFQELGPPWLDRFVNARRVRVSFLSGEDVVPLLTRPISEFDMTYSTGAIDRLVSATNCQPYLIQVIAFELVQLLNKEQRKEATPSDVERAIDKTFEKAGEYFAGVWEDAGPDGQVILREVVHGKPTSVFPEARRWLRENDVLTDSDTFAVDMMRIWVEASMMK